MACVMKHPTATIKECVAVEHQGRVAMHQMCQSKLPHYSLTSIVLATAVLAGSGFCSAEEFVIGDRTLQVAEGYEVELAADASLVARPIAVARDEKGRLYVTDSGGMSERAEKQLEEKPHSIRRLEDTDGDGRYDRSVLFADKMMFPEGCMWHEGSLYVAAPPEIWKLTDTDDDGSADKREVWFDGKTLTGCGNDLHGPYMGHDGRFYWCKGAFAEQKHTMSDGNELVTRSSHIFRAKADGTQMESVLIGGMDNPVNVAFLNNGERFLSCTFFQFPEAGRRDGLIHSIYGGVYGKKHDSIFAHPMTGDVMPVLNHQGAAAPCGFIGGSDALFGGQHAQQLFACYFNLHKVVQHRMIPNGPTYDTEDTDFLSCDHPDFHPTDVFEDADGSLLIVDTGGWYKVCCPTSQLAKPDVLGAIYRVRKKGASEVQDPLGTKLAWDKADAKTLAALLSDPRLFVQRRATVGLRNMGIKAVPSLRELISGSASADVRRRAVWTLCGIDDASAREAMIIGLTDKDSNVKQSAVHAIGLTRDESALPELLRIVSSGEPGPARAAAEAIGRVRNGNTVLDLLAAVGDLKLSGPDGSGAPANAAERIREHALIYALIEIANAEATAQGLESESPATVRAALVALDQMHNGGLKPEDVISRMSHSDLSVRSTAAWIVNRHSDWGSALSEYFTGRLAKAADLSEEETKQTRELLASLAGSPEIQALLLSSLQAEGNAAAQKLVLEILATSGLSSAPAAWFDALAVFLQQADAETLPLAIAAAQNLPLPKDGHAGLRDALAQLAATPTLQSDLRLNAIDAAGAGLSLDDNTFALLVTTLAPDLPMNLRSIAANRLASAVLSEGQLSSLIVSVKNVGPMELPRLLPAFEKGGSEQLGLQLVDSLLHADGVRGLRPDLIKPLLAKYPESVQTSGKALLKLLNASEEEQTAMLEKMLTTLPEGDLRRGHEVFMSRKAACSTCHKLGYGGGRLGPDLTSIGRVRNRRDLLEALIFPSASIVRGYEPVSAELEDGRIISGIITSESADEIVLSPDAQKTHHITRGSIVSIQPSNVSPMPNGLATLLTPQEIADLLAFLQSDQR
jgi:putative membrane-bound dehydrogenase-like protein